MSFSSDKTLSLTFNEVEALLSAIVDCDPALHQKLEKFVDECNMSNNRKNRAEMIFKQNECDILFQLDTFNDFKSIDADTIDIDGCVLSFSALFDKTYYTCLYYTTRNHLQIIQ